MADVAVLQLPTMSPPCLPARFPTNPASPRPAALALIRVLAIRAEGDLSEQKASVSAGSAP